MNGSDWLRKWSVYAPEKEAIRESATAQSATYHELNSMAERYTAHLSSRYDLGKGDRIAVLSPFNISLIALFGAAQKAGFILVPMNFRLTPTELTYQLQDSGAKLLVVDSSFEELAKDLVTPRISWRHLDEPADAPPFHSPINEDDPIFILYTSGTTGFPKGALYTHKMLFWNSINTALRLNLTADDVTVNCMPPFHTGGWNVLITPLLHHGATIHLEEKFDAEAVLSRLDETGATIFMAVPTMVKMMAEAQQFGLARLEALRYFIVGGEALPIPLIEQWAAKGVPIRQGYGLTEVGPNVTSLPQDDTIRKRGSIGFFNFYLEGKIASEHGEECGPNQIGELWLAGPNVTPGYWHNEEANAKSFEGKWFKTGDLVKKDHEGYLYIVGRKKEMYISGGENVYPNEIERVIQQIETVAEAAVIGVPDERWGESGAAFVSLKHDTNLTSESLKTHCQKYLAKFKIPKYFEIIDELPKNATGKIDKKHLLDHYLSLHTLRTES